MDVGKTEAVDVMYLDFSKPFSLRCSQKQTAQYYKTPVGFVEN